MSRSRKAIQSFLSFIFAFTLLLTFTSQAKVTHAASKLNSVTSNCVSPPANFNPLTATQSDVDQYGLPPKPTNQQDLQRWVKTVSSAKTRECGPPVQTSQYSQRLSTRTLPQGVTPNFSNTSWYTWSGYGTGWGYGSGFDEAYGNWNLPCVHSPDSYGYHSITWVGIGGWYNNENLLQAGTINDPTWGRQLWWEAWPSNYITVVPNITPNCGDAIFADVWVNYNTSTSYYWVEDMSKNQYATNHYNNFVPDRQSAEWIDERPTCSNGNYTPLANFSYTDFSNAYAEVTGGSSYGTLASSRAGSIAMVNSSGGSPIASPGALNSAGNGFRDYWHSTGTGQLC